ncbi:UNVERIFIED_CONTAM: hypothetical protein GTU68_035243 [Idotea baltica]|nr:hypothetical protein [Idotea baltica]
MNFFTPLACGTNSQEQIGTILSQFTTAISDQGWNTISKNTTGVLYRT